MFIHESLIVIQLQQLTHGRLILFSSYIIFHKCLNQTLNSMIPTLNMAWKVKVKSLNPIWLFVTLSTVAHQASLSTGFSRQEYWSGLPFSSPGGLPDKDWIQVFCIAGRLFTLWATRESQTWHGAHIKYWNCTLRKSWKGFWMSMWVLGNNSFPYIFIMRKI